MPPSAPPSLVAPLASLAALLSPGDAGPETAWVHGADGDLGHDQFRIGRGEVRHRHPHAVGLGDDLYLDVRTGMDHAVGDQFGRQQQGFGPQRLQSGLIENRRHRAPRRGWGRVGRR